MDELLNKLIQDKKIIRAGHILHLPEHQVLLSKEEELFLQTLIPTLKKFGTKPPITRELTSLLDLKLEKLTRLLRSLSSRGHLIAIGKNRFYLPETVDELRKVVVSLSRTHKASGFTVVHFRDLTSLGRNQCIEILEYFDRIGTTRRFDNHRKLAAK